MGLRRWFKTAHFIPTNSSSFKTQDVVMNRSMNIQQMIVRSPLSLLCLLGLTLIASPVAAQVFESGPSDAKLFDSIINVTDDPEIESTPSIGDGQSIGGDEDGLSIQLNVTQAGSVGFLFTANSGSEVNISSGSVGASFDANSGSEVNISGGSVGDGFDANSGSLVNISGGTVGDLFDANAGSVVNISGGSLGDAFDANVGSEVNISGGSVGNGFNASTTVNISGGSVGDDFDAFSGSVINISGGVVGASFDANFGSVVNISGGAVSAGFEASTGSAVTIRGGSVSDNFVVNGSISLVGRDFVLDGVSLDDGLKIGDALTVGERDVTLTGQFTDGTPFSFDLNSTSPDEGGSVFAPDANLTVTLFLLLGDTNQDGVLNFADIPRFVESILSGTFLAEADVNQDGEVNFQDVGPFIQVLIAN